MLKSLILVTIGVIFNLTPLFAKCPEKKSVETKISKIFSRKVTVKTVYPIEIEGICKVITDKAGDFFIDENEKYLMKGMIFKLPDKKVSEEFLHFLDKSTAFSVGNGNNTVYVIVDPECEACRKSSDKIKLFMENGIKLKFVLAPFSSKESENKAVILLCNNGGLKMFMSGKYNGKVCTTEKLKVWSVMDKLKARGLVETPIFITENGEVFIGSDKIENIIDKILNGEGE